MIRDLKEEGISNKEIARDLGMSRNTVSKLLRTTGLTDHRQSKRVSKPQGQFHATPSPYT
jgi:orotate phosphoribosyltransferase-like protein